jgi:REP element-mobilizing transposase RayT
MGQSCTYLLVHLIFSTKDRTPWINPSLKPRLHAYLGGIARNLKCPAVRIGGVADHVHVLTRLHATVSVASLVNALKANSSGWIHDEYGELREFAWQGGYGGFSVSRSHAERVQRYIENQELHHRTVNYQTELLEFLDRHGIDFDERYLWS